MPLFRKTDLPIRVHHGQLTHKTSANHMDERIMLLKSYYLTHSDISMGHAIDLVIDNR